MLVLLYGFLFSSNHGPYACDSFFNYIFNIFVFGTNQDYAKKDIHICIGFVFFKKVLSTFCNKVEFVDIDSDQQRFGHYRLALKSLATKDPYNINWLKSSRFTDVLQEMLQSSD